MTQANADFRAGLPDTLRRLGQAGSGFDPGAPSAALAAELQSLLHALAGAAVTFGFRELGQGARALEQRLRVLTAFEHVGADDWRAWLASLDEFVRGGLAAPQPAYHSAAFSLLP
ncbi:Hpt domain-containing protein [Massilia sp. Mn16-1_5]|uniref:Hpt domain-containing protein n=1 Tax=Massilia sp. Mn16-1_5 TaxID=2079199 RepID=UPI001E60ED00|nr:Hpt domain-containing protein [Massilia sp. Mn16-1_5]